MTKESISSLLAAVTETAKEKDISPEIVVELVKVSVLTDISQNLSHISGYLSQIERTLEDRY